MPEDEAQGCVAAAAGPMVAATDDTQDNVKKERTMHVSVGKQAPDFEAAAFADGGFKNVKLSDFRGKWVFLCFYPGDFTFV